MKRVKKIVNTQRDTFISHTYNLLSLTFVFIDVNLLWLHQFGIIIRWMRNHNSLIIAKYTQYCRMIQTELNVTIILSFHVMSS